jgi:ribosome biogenesis GTPase / thiamine phosphate phosphatase
MADALKGQVLFGINTIYTVAIGSEEIQCRIKGKVIHSGERSYNPIAAGDFVDIARDALTTTQGKIVALHPRCTELVRWNKKGRARQVLAANADLAVCVSSPQSPPFRPRFIDRVIAAAETGKMVAMILMNKSDLGIDAAAEERLADFTRIGYPVLRCSAKTGEGIVELRNALRGRTSAFIGQSGVGKSSVLNVLSPGLGQKTGEISAKHDRGNHTTNFSVLLRLEDGINVIDTPGIRELEIAGILPDELAYSFREFAPFAARCEVPVCPHEDEPGCAVRGAVERGELHHDRYESYLRILFEMKESRRTAHG